MMEELFSFYKKWREETQNRMDGTEDAFDESGKKEFMKYAKLRRLDDDDFEELEMQYDEYLIAMETEE